MNADLAAPAAPAGVSQRLVAVLENVAIARIPTGCGWTTRSWRGSFFRDSF
jgi:hypothetical protein